MVSLQVCACVELEAETRQWWVARLCWWCCSRLIRASSVCGRGCWWSGRRSGGEFAALQLLSDSLLHPAAPNLDPSSRCREILKNSPTALRVLKSALNAAEDGQAGIQQLGGDATLLFYQSEEGNEVRGGW